MEYIYQFFKLFSEFWLLILIFLLSYFPDRKNFFKILALTITFSSVLNTILKELWQVPLDPSIRKMWWGFPSGHMQNAAIFYLGTAIYLARYFGAFIALVILYGMSQAYIYYKFHDEPEMFAAFFIAIVLLVITKAIYELQLRYKFLLFIYGIFITISSAFIIFFGLKQEITFYSWLFITLAMGFGITLTMALQSKQNERESSLELRNKKLSLAIAIILCAIAIIIMKMFLAVTSHTFYTLIIYFSVSFIFFFIITYMPSVILKKFN